MVAETRAERILSHLAAYRVSTREIMMGHLFDGSDIGRDLFELSTEQGLVSVRPLLRHRRSYYQLSRSGASRLGLSEHWARPLGAQALITNLSIAWFCCMGKYERRRLRRDVLANAYGVNIRGGNHCVEKGERTHRVYKVYVPMPGTSPREIMRSLGDLVEQAITTPGLDKLIARREYGFAVLLETSLRVTEIRDRIRTHDARDGLPLAGVAHFCVEGVPEYFLELET